MTLESRGDITQEFVLRHTRFTLADRMTWVAIQVRPFKKCRILNSQVKIELNTYLIIQL